jgi:hypothetical protein
LYFDRNDLAELNSRRGIGNTNPAKVELFPTPERPNCRLKGFSAFADLCPQKVLYKP